MHLYGSTVLHLGTHSKPDLAQHDHIRSDSMHAVNLPDQRDPCSPITIAKPSETAGQVTVDETVCLSLCTFEVALTRHEILFTTFSSILLKASNVPI